MIAIPSYQGYVAKAQASEALSLASNFKAGSSEDFSKEGKCPTRRTINQKSKNVEKVDLDGTYSESGGCTITSTMTGNVSGELKGKTLTLELEATQDNIDWKCTSSIPQKYLPKACVGVAEKPATPPK